jgi:PAS domain S-box-containing protein
VRLAEQEAVPMAANSNERQQIHQWQALLDSAGEGIWGLDLEGNCTFVNRVAVNTFGFANEELVGKNMHDLVHHHYPDGREFPGEECPIHQVLRKNNALRQLTDTMFRKDGSAFVAELSAQPVLVEGEVVGVVVTFRDVTEGRKQQEDLHKSYELAEQQRAELDAVIESMPHGVYIARRSDSVPSLRLNRCAREMSGAEFPKEFSTLERALDGKTSEETMEVRSRWIQSIATPIWLNGDIIGGVAVNTDVTEKRLQNEALRRSEKLAAVGQLTSSIAHEINNPLESITNLLYLMRLSDSLEEMQEYAAIAQGELARVTEITLQTLRFHRHHNKPMNVDMEDLIRSVLALYTGRLLVRKITAEFRLRKSPLVICLEGEIRQVLNNLVRNALDAMSIPGRLLVRLSPSYDQVRGRSGVRLTVADTGEGIRSEIAARLFEPFQTTKELTGTGLGLWVSKGIVEKHGGYIRTRSQWGEKHGTVFAVWLPLDGGSHLIASV